MIYLPPMAELVLLSLYQTPNLTLEQLSESTGASESALREAIRLLEDVGFIANDNYPIDRPFDCNSFSR